MPNRDPIEVAASLTPEGKKFLIDLCGIVGNNIATTEMFTYYLGDMYTWFRPNALLSKYSKEALGGFLANLSSKGIVYLEEDREESMTEFGVRVALIVLGEAGL